MAKWGYKNLTMGQLNADIANDATSIILKSGQGALFPSDLPFRVIIWGKDFTQPYEDANAEIVEATLDSVDTFTIERGKEGTSGYAWKEDDNFMLTLTAEQLEEFDNKTQLNSAVIEIKTTDWSNDEATISVSGITSDNIVWVSPTPTSYEDYVGAEIRAISQGINEITFSCEVEPENDIDVVVIFSN